MDTETKSKSREVKLYENIKTEKNDKSEAIIEGEITTEALAFYRIEALDHFKKEMELPGFRKGHVPEKMVLEKIGELALLEEAGELILQKALPEIIKEEKLDIISRPEVAITKLSLGSPISFKITVAIFPTFTLPDFKKIAKEVNEKIESIEVTDKEVDDAVLQIRRMRAEHDHEESHDHSDPNHTHEPIKDEDLPELTDESVKSFGKFESILDFKMKLRESITREKELKNKEKTRLSIIERIIEKSDIPLPQVLIEAELDRMLDRMADDIERMGMKFEDYLKRTKKEITDLRKEWEEDAKKRAKMDLIIDAIGREEKITAPDTEVETEVKHLMEHYADADPIRAASYFRHVIRNEKVFQFLESIS